MGEVLDAVRMPDGRIQPDVCEEYGDGRCLLRVGNSHRML